MLSGAGRSYLNRNNLPGWMSFDMPFQIIDGNGHSSTFTYGPEHQRTKQARGDLTEYYADGVEIDIPANAGMATANIKTYWPAGLGVEIDHNGTTNATTENWTHDDRLGSVTAITDQSGTMIEEMPYDAWGNRRPLAGTPVTASAAGYAEVVDNKGFTGQEELDQLGLVHLNGRIYDPFTGRFLSGDPEIQDPTHSQSYNRYTYVWNNPTNLTDPTGFDAATVEITATRIPTCTGACVEAFLAAARTMALGFVRRAPIVLIIVMPGNAGQDGCHSGDLCARDPKTGELTHQAWIDEGIKLAEEHKKEEEKKAEDEKKNDEEALDKKDGKKDGKTLPKPPTGQGSVPKDERDPKRYFDKEERERKRAEQNHECANGCGTEIDASNSAGHHIDRHADGGRTVPENHAEVCVDCHIDLHSGN